MNQHVMSEPDMSNLAMDQTVVSTTLESVNQLQEIFKLQRSASRQPPLSLKSRLESLHKLEQILITHQDDIAGAINKDFGNRSSQETLMLEIFGLLGGIKYSRKMLKKWMKPQKRHVGLSFFGAKNTVVPQPKGVVGIISPWNYPLFLALSPCISALGAGNRCVIKMASNSQHLCRLLAKLVGEQFNDDVLAIIPGVSANDFNELDWDHLVFTGSSGVGKKVMTAAAKNLTPVTLELGGKSPTIITNDYNLKKAVSRVLFAKLLNAGQTCVAPDHIYIPRNKVAEFVKIAKEIVSSRYKDITNTDYTAIIDEKAYTRIKETRQDAIARGAEVINLLNGVEFNDEKRKMSPHLVLNSTEDMLIMQEEIFGPLLPVIAYDNLEDVVDKINQGDRPLAIYIYSDNKVSQQCVINNTMSGGICINDSMLHVAQHDLPFGGIGNSGMGHYHGQDGFTEFSKLRPIFKQAKLSLVLLMAPPYGKTFQRMTKSILQWKLY